MDNITLSSVMEQENFQDSFQLALYEEAYAQFCNVNVIIETLQINNNKDQWKYTWESGQYSSVKAYKHPLENYTVHILCIDGYGHPNVNQSIKCSFGFYSKIG
jgi:hypothetical protein